MLSAISVAHAASTCPANNTLSTPTADFNINGDGTVSHLKTGLMWKQCAEGLSGASCATGGAMAGATLMNWSAALSAAATPFAGYSDWRLPNQKELQSIVETGCYSPSVNETAFPATPVNNFWSSTAYASSPANTWFVLFSDGSSNVNIKTISYYARLVRGGQPFDSFDARKKGQVIVFGTASTVAVGGTGTVSATGGPSLNPVIFTSISTGVCTITGSTLTGVSAGACTIAANQAGNTFYNAASPVTQGITIDKSSQTIGFGPAPTIVVDGTGLVSAFASSGLAVSKSSLTPGVGTVSGNTVTGITVGTCTLSADQHGNANYYAASQAMQSFNIGKGGQIIVFGVAPTLAGGAPATVSATGGASGNPVTFSSSPVSVCTVSGSTVTGVTVGACTIAADQAGNANYYPAPQVLQVIQSLGLDASIPLNDSGQDSCWDGSALAACSLANSGNAAAYPRQDGRFGRDAAAAAGQLTKVGAGDKGFDFTRVCMSGELAGQGACPANPVQGTGASQWACTKDNVTHRVWSLESGQGNWSPYASSTYPIAMNATNRCGYNTGWRLPTRRELFSISDQGRSYPSIDAAYFPGTASSYWSADSLVAPSAPGYAWAADFLVGGNHLSYKSDSNSVRLVRSAQ